MSTIADVAARAGVSKATASRALSGNGYVSYETRRRVTDAASERLYVAHSSATSLATGRTQTVGVIDGQERIVIEHVNRMAADLAPDWPVGTRGVDGIYTIHIDGDPAIDMEMTVGTHGTATDGATEGTGGTAD